MITASVVVTNFNYGHFLRDSVDSALAQGEAVQVIVVDDGSTDGSQEIISSYGGSIASVLKANGGQASALNAGFEVATGAVVCFLDADDMLAPATMPQALRLFEAEPFAKLHWPLIEVDADGRPLGGTNPPAPLPQGDLRDLVVGRGPGAYTTPPSSGNAFSHAFLERVLPVPEELRVAADAYLYDLAPLYGRVARLEQPGGRIRFHDASNFMAQPYDRRLPHSVLVHEVTIQRMAKRCRELGLEPDEAGWRERSWPLRSQRALAEIDQVVPASTPFFLVDGGRLGVEPTATRPLVRLPEHPHDDAAIAELERGHEGGERFLVVAWPSFPWFDAMAGFRTQVRSSYRLVLDNDRLRVFARG